MRISVVRFVDVVLLAFVALICPAAWAADGWPTKPITILLPFPTGTPPDISTRVLADRMGAALGQPVIVENRPGAIGTVALNELMRRPADGHTLYHISMPVSVAPSMLSQVRPEQLRELMPVGQYDWTLGVLVATNSLPVKDAKALIALLRKEPGRYNYASGGPGTPAHLAGALFLLQAQVQAEHVPYIQFPQIVPDLRMGRVHYMFMTATAALPEIRAGNLRALAVIGDRRMPALPDVPTLKEQGIENTDVRNWDGFMVRPGTPAAIVERLNREMHRALQTPEVKERFEFLGATPVMDTPAAFGALIDREITRWGNVVRDAKIQVD